MVLFARFADWLISRSMMAMAWRELERATLGDPCDQLSDDDANGDVPALPRDFVGERISHSTENDRG